MRNISLGKPYTKCGGDTIPRPFSKKSELDISLDQQPNFIQFAFIICQVKRLPKYIETKLQTTCFYLKENLFKKQKQVWNWSPYLIFSV